MSIFKDPSLDCKDKKFYVVEYHPYHCGTNPKFDKNSGLILDFKEGKSRAIDWAFNLLNPEFGSDFAIAIVPPHEQNGGSSSLVLLAKKILAANNTLIDATDCLVRFKAIEKLARGGERSVKVHLDSIKVQNEKKFHGKDVLVLDDVQTTGFSLDACLKLIEGKGAKGVWGISIAKTFS